MAHADFVHLRVHTTYSLSEGAITVKELAELCQRHRMPAVAIADTNNLFGALEFSESLVGAGVQPIIGCQIAVTRADAANAPRGARKPPPDWLVLLAQDDTGYRNLMWLSSRAFLESPPGEAAQVAWDDVARHAGGLIALSGGTGGALGRLVGESQIDAAETLLASMMQAFPGRLYIELQRHGLPAEQRIEAGLLNLAQRHALPIVATNECFFAGPEMYEAHDALLCIADGAHVAQADRRRVTPEHRFRTAEEMRLLFADLPEAVDNTLVIARRCAVMAEKRDPLLPHFATRDGESEADLLKRDAEAGLARRLAAAGIDGAAAEPYRQRLAFELDVISRMGFAGYFLIVADFIQWAKGHGIPVGPGRGSGAGSVVAWSLTITDLDPLRLGLLFERFLNPERVSMPDFDIDFCQDRRDEVIRYVQDKYGADRVAHIITFGKLQARAALRDVGRVLGVPLGQVDRICKLVPNNPANPVGLAQAIESEPRLQDERDRDPAVARMMEIALKLEGMYRNASTHAAGVVIADRPLTELVPLYRDPRSTLPATQFAMKYAEAAGLVKFDFLGLKTLTVLDEAVKLIKRRGGAIDLANLPAGDPATYAMLARGETVGVFQLESSGMRDALRPLKPDCFEDIVAIVALYRPGPMDNIPRYIHCKHGVEKPDYLHEMLQPILKETYGVIIYQEQVMEIAKVLAGYSLGEADLLRRAMGKKIKSEMDAQKERFVEGAVAKGVPLSRATYIFELVQKFAGYGFNKSHAAAYAVIAYQTAYLKANYRLEFLAASMTYELSNTDRLNLFRQELSRLGVALLPPDVNRSEVGFSVEYGGSSPGGAAALNLVLQSGAPSAPGAIRYALAAVKTVGAAAISAVVAERKERGAFKSLADFASRLGPGQLNKRMLENLAKAGAFDALEPDRAKAHASVDAMLGTAGARGREQGQAALFGEADLAPSLPTIKCEPWPAMERLAREFEAIGFYLSAHPLDAYAKALNRIGVVGYADAVRNLGPAAQRIRLAGTVIRRQERTSAKGNRYAFVQCSDPSGMFEVTVFSEQLAGGRELLDAGRSLVMQIDARLEGEQIRLTAQTIEALDAAVGRAAQGARVVIADAAALAPLRAVLSKAGKGNGLVKLGLRLNDLEEEAEFRVPGGYAIAPTVYTALNAIPGVLEVQEL
jgi:DNA polymerase III subunit alpha